MIARRPALKSINGPKGNNESTKPYRTAVLSLFSVILAKQGTFEGFYMLGQPARQTVGTWSTSAYTGCRGQTGIIDPVYEALLAERGQ